MVQRVNRRRKTTVKTEDLVLNQGSEGEIVKEVGEGFPNVGVSILAETLVIESIDLSNLTRLVVSAEDGNAILIADLKGDQEGHGLDRVVTAIDVVTHEEIVRVGRVAADAEELHEIVELTVNITTDGDGAAHRLDVGLFHQDLACLLAKSLDIGLRELLALHQVLDPAVNITDISNGCHFLNTVQNEKLGS